ncbi:hypothetical protein FRC08_000833 [Ceratobasidium sp. 394]|nr:hypothetical protein FRC08_000833 [Ceratobasidium sp. 394]
MVDSLSSISGLGSLITMLLSFSGLRDWLKLIVLGGALETLRRCASSCWEWALGAFFLTIHLDNDDIAYDWMMIWLSLQPAWRKAREVQISSKDYGLNRNATVVVPGETDATGETRSVAYLPTYNSTHGMIFNNHWMRVTRTRQDLGEGCTRESLQIRHVQCGSPGFAPNLLVLLKQPARSKQGRYQSTLARGQGGLYSRGPKSGRYLHMRSVQLLASVCVSIQATHVINCSRPGNQGHDYGRCQRLFIERKLVCRSRHPFPTRLSPLRRSRKRQDQSDPRSGRRAQARCLCDFPLAPWV